VNAPEFDRWTRVDARWTPKQPAVVSPENESFDLSREIAEAL
jgi:hypothetical protein